MPPYWSLPSKSKTLPHFPSCLPLYTERSSPHRKLISSHPSRNSLPASLHLRTNTPNHAHLHPLPNFILCFALTRLQPEWNSQIYQTAGHSAPSHMLVPAWTALPPNFILIHGGAPLQLSQDPSGLPWSQSAMAHFFKTSFCCLSQSRLPVFRRQEQVCFLLIQYRPPSQGLALSRESIHIHG